MMNCLRQFYNGKNLKRGERLRLWTKNCCIAYPMKGFLRNARSLFSLLMGKNNILVFLMTFGCILQENKEIWKYKHSRLSCFVNAAATHIVLFNLEKRPEKVSMGRKESDVKLGADSQGRDGAIIVISPVGLNHHSFINSYT